MASRGGTAQADVVIIGGGISGTAAAYELARAGVAVILVEQDALASMASGWTLGGVRQSGRDPAELPLATAAVRRWPTLAAELEADLEYRQEGNLRLARTPAEVPIIAKLVDEQRALGLDLTFLPDRAAVRAVAPALGETVRAASYCPTDGHANPIATVRAFAAAAERHGARIRTETRVTGIELAGGRVGGVATTTGPIAADTVVVAAGVYSDALCAMVGLSLPLTVCHATIVQTVPLPPVVRPVLGVANADFAARQEVGGRMRLSGDADAWRWPAGGLDGDAVQPSAATVVGVLARATAILPTLASAGIGRVWGGLLDMTPDGLPVIERAPEVDGLVIAAGFSGHGFCLGPITGQLVRELVTTGQPSLPLDAFRRARFAGMTGIAAATLHG
ncbi:MAG TPA: FAD-binding oxidoreductase [Methylomirabilota bacterium]|nr:FAD-binding oxidoreductase [Methylomirabilota bacterium]